MTGRLKLLAAAFGLVLATGTFADVSAQTVANPTTQAQTAATKTTPTKVTQAKGHRTMKIARKGHRVHLAKSHRHAIRHLASHRHLKPVAKATIGTKTIKQASTPHRERHAMNHRVTTKATSVLR